MMSWVKIEDATPDVNATVFCYGQYSDDDIDDELYRFSGYIDSKGRWYACNNGDYVDGGYGNDYRARVTHWMPLPEPPTT